MTRRVAARAVPFQLLMAVFIGISLGYIDLYLFSSGAISTPAAYIFLALLIGCALPLIARAAASAPLAGEVIALYTTHAAVLAALVAITACAFVGSFLPGAYWDEGPRFLLFPLYDSLVLGLAMLLPVTAHHRRHFSDYLLCAFVILLASIFYDAYYPATFSLVPDRAAGFAENPNTAAFVLLLLCACQIDLERERLKSHLVLALTGLGVLMTLSRGGGILMGWMLAFYLSRIVSRNRHQPGRLIRMASVIALVLGTVYVISVFMMSRAEMFALSYQPRLDMLHGNEEVVPLDDDRIGVFKVFAGLLAGAPFLGYGTGYSYSMFVGPHNIYLQQWINNGLPGLAAYLALLFACARVFWKRRYFRGLLFLGLVTINGVFNHNILEERAFLVLLGVLLTTSFYGGDAGSFARRAKAQRGSRGPANLRPIQYRLA